MVIRKIPVAVLALPIVLSACTFGEGPELSFSAESSATDGNADSQVGESVLEDGNTESDVAQSSTVPTSDTQLTEPQSSDQQMSEVQVSEVPSASNQSSDSQPNSNPVSASSDLSVDSSADSSQQTDALSLDDTIDLSQPDIVRIPATDSANAPSIDGSLIDYIDGTELLDGEWRFAAQRNARNESLSIANRMFGISTSSLGNGRHHWAAMHDGVYLYLLVVSDDASEHYQDTNEERKPWKDDSIEIFIDGNNSRLDNYDGVDDFHMTINLRSIDQTANSSYVDSPLVRQSDSSATLPSDFLFSASPAAGPVGQAVRGRKDIYELRLKLSELNIVLEQPFGIEIQINDDDDGGTRDEKWGWYHPEGSDDTNDYTWQNPSVMGQAVLVR